ncbi:MAG: hypothetical protein QOJ16_3843, partial [Acidobacteriota bacterium]|nr:hypothetical protein [Acidobacteriota bacterium]
MRGFALFFLAVATATAASAAGTVRDERSVQVFDY